MLRMWLVSIISKICPLLNLSFFRWIKSILFIIQIYNTLFWKNTKKQTFFLENCKKTLDSTSFNQANGDKIYCTSCYRKQCGLHVYGFVAGAMLPTVADMESPYKEQQFQRQMSNNDKFQRCFSKMSINPADRCGCCGKQVFFVEEIRVGKKKWHKSCFRCGHCSKYIEPGKCNEHDGDLFCSNCYSRFFGPCGYGYASGNGSIFSTDCFSSTCSLSRTTSDVALTRGSSEVDSSDQSSLVVAFQN